MVRKIGPGLVRNISELEHIMEHGGTCYTWVLFSKPKELKYTAFAAEFEIKGGEHLQKHIHNTEEFYYVTYGRGEMTIGDETKDVFPGDLIFIPPNQPHTIRPKGVPDKNNVIHCFCFATPTEEKIVVKAVE